MKRFPHTSLGIQTLADPLTIPASCRDPSVSSCMLVFDLRTRRSTVAPTDWPPSLSIAILLIPRRVQQEALP